MVAVLAVAGGWRRGASLAVGAAALIAIVIGATLLVNTSATPGPAPGMTSAVPAVTAAHCCRLSPSVTRAAEDAVVIVRPLAAHSGVAGCGVVVGDGLVVTTVEALGTARRVRVISATGRSFGGTLVASDPDSGIALLRISGTLPAIKVARDGAVSPGDPELAVSMHTSAGSSVPRAEWAAGTVISDDQAPARGAASTMAQIVVRGPSIPAMPGEPLFDQSGHVVGMLDGSTSQERSFLPIPLILAVSDQLDAIGHVRHGWLGVTDATGYAMPGGAGARKMSGAEVLWIDPHGASHKALEVGDVIVRVDAHRVSSSAELRSLLYMIAPGSTVSLEVIRGGVRLDVDVRLAPSP